MPGSLQTPDVYDAVTQALCELTGAVADTHNEPRALRQHLRARACELSGSAPYAALLLNRMADAIDHAASHADGATS